jgi:hypothetical protein
MVLATAAASNVAPSEWAALIAMRKGVASAIAAGVSGYRVVGAGELDAAPAAGKEEDWLTKLGAEVKGQLDTVQGWIGQKTESATAKAKAALEAIKPMLERAQAVADTLVLTNPLTAAPTLLANLTNRTTDMVQSLGGVSGVANLVLLALVLYAAHELGFFGGSRR